MKKQFIALLLAAWGFGCVFSDGLAQGPPINIDSPILLGLSGRAVRTFGRVIRLTKLLQEGEEIADALDREVTVLVTPLAVPYNFSDRVQVAGIFPLVHAHLDTRNQNLSSTGLGDIQFFAKYVFYKHDAKNKTFRVAARVNLKLPTGDEDETPALGSGSTDYSFALVGGWIKHRVGVYVEGVYGLNTSHRGTNFGNSVSYNLALGYRLLPVVYERYPSPQWNAYLEINGTTAAKNDFNGAADQNSGGTTIFLSPGLQYIGGRLWLVEASFQYPIVDDPNGLQLGTDWTASLGIRVLLY